MIMDMEGFSIGRKFCEEFGVFKVGEKKGLSFFLTSMCQLE